jgi:hypothetical protein
MLAPCTIVRQLATRHVPYAVFTCRVCGVSLPGAGAPPPSRAVAPATTRPLDRPCLLSLQYRVSLCHTPTATMFGRTHCSEELPLPPADGDGLVRCSAAAVTLFHSPIRDDGCVAVVEAVVVARHGDAGLKLGEFGVGWAVLNLFSPSRRVWDAADSAGGREGRDVPVDTGLCVCARARARAHSPHECTP